MKRFVIFCTAIVMSVTALHAQERPRTQRTQSVNLNILGLQYNYEMPLSRLSTVSFHGGVCSDLVYSRWSTWDGNTDSEWAYSFRGIAGADIRYFYNLDRRARKGKNTGGNSGNFLAVNMWYVSAAIYSNNIETSNGFLIIPNYGFRRVYRSGVFIEPSFGYAIGYDFTQWGGSLKLDFKLGYKF